MGDYPINSPQYKAKLKKTATAKRFKRNAAFRTSKKVRAVVAVYLREAKRKYDAELAEQDKIGHRNPTGHPCPW